MTLGQRVAVLRDGVLQQVAPPMEVYRRPANRFVAGFVGSPEMNFFEGELREGGGRTRFEGPGLGVELAGGAGGRPEEAGGVAEGGPAGSPAGRAVVLGIRPQDVELVEPDAADLVTTVEVVEPLGSEVLLHLARPEGGGPGGERSGTAAAAAEPDEIRALVPAERATRVEDRVGLRLRRDRLHLFGAGDGGRIS